LSVRTVLKSRWSGRLLVGLIALSVAIFTALLLAGRAEAQEDEAQEEAAAANTKTKTVEPGDSLWAIAQERLAPDASPQRVAEEVERTYALNRERLGEDPNLIRVGQELTLSPATSEPEPVEPEPVEPEPVETATYEPASGSEHVVNRERAAAEPPSEASAEASAEAGAEPVVLPELPEADAKLVASFVEAPSVTPERTVAETRRKAGYAVLLCTAAVALLGTARLLIAERQ
jgi:LysM repeat protein